MSDPSRDRRDSPRATPLDRKAHVRPRFELTTEIDKESVLDRVRAAIKRSDLARGMVLDSGRIELICAEDRVRFWSPQLTVDTEAGERGTVLRARFCPHPHVWTLYLALYATSVAFAIGCIMFGISQWMVGSEPWSLLLTPFSLILSGLVYGASFVGQGLGALQMQELRGFLERAIGFDAASPEP